MDKILAIIFGIIFGIPLMLLYLALQVIAGIAAVACGCAIIITFFVWCGYHMYPTITNWHTLMHGWATIGVCALIVFMIKGLPLLLIRTEPSLDEPFFPARSRALRLRF